MKDTVLFNGMDEETEIEVSALEIKEYTNSEINQRLSDLESNSSQNKQELETSIDGLRTDIEKNKEAISQNALSIVSLEETIKGVSDSLTSINDSVSDEIANRQSGIESAKTELTALIDSKIEAEKESREQTENAFRSQIEQESKDRQEADSELKAEILQEISNSLTAVDFATADKVLKQDLTSHIETMQSELTTEINDFESRLDSFQTSLNEEIAALIKADNALQGNSNNSGSGDYNLNYEIMTIDHLDAGQITDDSIFLQSLNSSDSYITALQIKKYIDAPTNAKFDNEVIERKAEDSKLAARLTTETTNRIDADNNLQSQVDSLDSRQTETESIITTLTGTGEGSIKKSISDKIAEVVSDAPEAFDTLKEIADWINTHEDSAAAMNTAIQTNAANIAQEISDRQSDTVTLQANIGTEKTARENADSTLQATIDAEASARESADTTLQSNIDALSEKLDEEKVARENGDTETLANLTEVFSEQVAGIANEKVDDVINERMRTYDTAIANAKKSVTSAQVIDTRGDNQTPEWYFENYPRQVVHEFKFCNVIGISGTIYCDLETIVHWSDASGGYPIQMARYQGTCYVRYGTSATAWSAWTKKY